MSAYGRGESHTEKLITITEPIAPLAVPHSCAQSSGTIHR